MSSAEPIAIDGALALWRHRLLGLLEAGEDPSGRLAEPLRDMTAGAHVLFTRWTGLLGLAALDDAARLREIAFSTPTDALPGATFGGSEAQRDMLHDTDVAVLADAGRAEDALANARARDAQRPWQRDRRLLVPRCPATRGSTRMSGLRYAGPRRETIPLTGAYA